MSISDHRTRNFLIGLLAAASTSAIVGRGADAPSPSSAARGLLADVLVQDARTRSRDSRLPPALAARQACTLLQAANQLDPSDAATLRLLADAALATKQPAVQRDALRQTLKVDPGNLVAQVQFLDLLALEAQALEQRARVYQAALDKTTLDPQVRSEMAVRLAAITFERGDSEQARNYLKTALQLNDVNVAALQWQAKLAAPGTPNERLTSLTNLLAVDPYLPEEWVAGARILATTNLHSLAADWYNVAIEQTNKDGLQAPADIYLERAWELAIAGRRTEAGQLVPKVVAPPDAPLSALLLAQAFTQEVPPREGPATAPGPATLPLDAATRLRDKLTADVKADPKNAKVLAESLTIAAALLPDPGPDFPAWLESYRALARPDDKLLGTIAAWRDLQTGKPDLARERLLSLSDPDVPGRIALARACALKGQAEEARKILQDLYDGHPSGLYALLIAQTARASAVRLADTALTREMLALVSRIGPAITNAHRQPRDLVLVTAALPKRHYVMGEPIMLTIRQSNTTDHALPVGPNGVVRTRIGVTGATRGMKAQSLGMFATDDCFRTYRLEKRSSLQYDVRVDQGRLADLFEMNPVRSFNIALTALTAPRGDARIFGYGLGGQSLTTSDLDKTGLPYRTLDEVKNALGSLSTLPQEQQMVVGWSLGVVLSAFPEETARPATAPASEPAASNDIAALRAKLITTLIALAKSDSPTMVAWMMRMTPRSRIPAEVVQALDALPAGGEAAPPFTPIARMMWAERCAAIADAEGGPVRAAAIDHLKDLATHENDPLVKDWFAQLVEKLNLLGSTTAPGVKDPRTDLQLTPSTQPTDTRISPTLTPPTSTQPTNP